MMDMNTDMDEDKVKTTAYLTCVVIFKLDSKAYTSSLASVFSASASKPERRKFWKASTVPSSLSVSCCARERASHTGSVQRYTAFLEKHILPFIHKTWETNEGTNVEDVT